jgi:hypothetical protein
MRLLVTGKTRSGESMMLHRILSHTLRLPCPLTPMVPSATIVTDTARSRHPAATPDTSF